jgi:hypothetical protein
MVTFLSVSLAIPVTDITSVEGHPNDAVMAFENEEVDHAIFVGMTEKMRLTVGYLFKRDDYLPGTNRNRGIFTVHLLFFERPKACPDRQQRHNQPDHQGNFAPLSLRFKLSPFFFTIRHE